MRWPWERDLTKICNAVRFDASNTCLFAGRHIDNKEGLEVAHTANERSLHSEFSGGDDSRLFAALSNAVYLHCFARSFTGELPTSWPIRNADSVPDECFKTQLAEANQSRSGWDSGWEICRVGADRDVQVRNGDRYRTVPAGQYAFTAGPGLLPTIGDYVSLQVLRESHHIQPGMYFVFGETLTDQFDEADRVRFYFHLDPQGAPQLIKLLTTTLNRFQIAFDFKCQKYQQNYDRLDASVLYIARRYCDIVYRLVVNCAAAMNQHLRATVPMFTKRIHMGIGVADDPGGNLSFGQSRCELVAAALLDARRDTQVDPQEFMGALKRRFESHGLSFENPYLNPGRVEMFDASHLSEFAS